MIKVCSSQFNHLWGRQIHFPYSVAMLVAYAKTKPTISSELNFEKTFIFRDKILNDIRECSDAEILLCSCYVWNWEITTHLAKEVKKINPSCLIIFGGPQVPDDDPTFFEKYPFVDIIVHGEGEIVSANILDAYLKDKDFSKILGIETKNFKNNRQPRIMELDDLPSPYLTDVIWELTEKNDKIDYLASWESNRGCPYPCTFCDWGSLTAQRMSMWDEDRLYKEIEWFGKNKITYVDSCDANFGILQEKDLKLAKKLSDTSLKTGFPQRVRLSWAKFSSDKIIPLAKELQRADLLRAVTLSLQSLDETTLQLVKRENIKFDKFSTLTDTFREHKIPTYTELIMGLPGETLDSWKKGLELLASDGKIDSIFIYNCSVLPNAPMNQPSYMKFNGIKTLRSPIYLPHSSIHNDEKFPEYEEIVVRTSSLSLDELKKTFIYSWCIQAFHSLGVLEYISKYYVKTHNMKYMEFYDDFIEFCMSNSSIFSKEYEIVTDYIKKGYSGGGWDHYDPKLGEIYWSIEEATWLRCAYNKKDLEQSYNSFINFLEQKYNFQTSKKMIDDLIKFQLFLLTTREDFDEIKSADFMYNWKDFFVNNIKLVENLKKYYYTNLVAEKDPSQWAYKTIWFGRYGTKYKFHPEFLEERSDQINLKPKLINA